LCVVANISAGEMGSVDMEVFAGDCGSRMGRVAGPMVALLFVFARTGGAGTAWGVLAPLAVRICSLTK
jgi:hypothetical protein